MSNVLKYKFYLNFKNEGSFGRIEITEPIGFDGASFVVEQESKRYGRDAYRINEEVNLNFYKGSFDATDTFRQLPNGTVIYNLTQGFEELIDCYNRFGFESDVDFEIELEDTIFIPANLDFQTSETDGFTYFSCKALQESSKQLLKRRTDLVVDVFSNKDVDGNDITPLQTINVLQKSKPVVQESRFNPDENIIAFETQGTRRYFYPTFRQIELFGIEDTFTSFEPFFDPQFGFESEAIEGCIKIKAQNDLTNINIVITNLSVDIDLGNQTNEQEFAQIVVDYGTGFEVGEFERFIAYTEICPPEQTTFSINNLNLDFNINSVSRGGFISVYVNVFYGTSGNRNISYKANSGTLSIKATSTAIDTVIKGVRWIDLIKQNVKSLNGFDVVVPQLEQGGEHYDNIATTGNLIKRRDDVAFPVKFDDLMDMLMEHNGDYQILNNKVYINKYKAFYPNKEIGAFVTAPDDSFKSTFNERFALNQLDLEFDKFEQDKDEGNTIDAVHTNTQWSFDNKQVENTKGIKLKQIRDPFKIQFSINEAVKTTTSTNDDDSIFLINIVPLAPNTRGGFTSSMTHNVINEDSETFLQLLKDAELPSWSVLGFDVGITDFVILTEDNEGTYEVVEITDTIIKLKGIGVVPTFNGVSLTEVEYPYTNVLYTNRTNEGFDLVENVLSPDKFGNLLYTPKRILKEWLDYFATVSIFKPLGSLRNRYFRNNGDLTTRLSTETENVIEKEDILNSELPNPILTPYIYETKLLVPFDKMSEVLEAVNTINEDNSIGGFIRCIDNNGRVIRLYPKTLDYIPSTETLTLTGEQRFDGNGVNITIARSEVIINEVGYDLDALSEPFYEFDGDYFKIYDINKLAVITPTRYTDIKVNGLTFNSASELLNYLLNV